LLACIETITVLQLDYDATLDKDVYKSWIVRDVSWFSKLIVGLDGKGLTGKSEFRVRIPSSIALPTTIQPGDIIVRGNAGIVQKAADFKDREHFTVLSVGDNRRGSIPHWAVSGA